MPLFDPANPRGPDAATLVALATLLSELAVFQELCEVDTTAEARAKIITGVHAQPADGVEFTPTELESQFVFAQINPPIPADSLVLMNAGSPTPLTGGGLDVLFRRHARESEIVNDESRNDVYLFFYDCITAIKRDLMAEADPSKRSCPRLRHIAPLCDGAFGSFDETSAQGEYLWAKFRVYWGDGEEA